VAALSVRPVQAEHAGSFFGAVGRDPVHHPVGAAVQPRAVRDLPVRRFDIRSLGEEERADDLSRVVLTDIAAALMNVLYDKLLRRPVCRYSSDPSLR
jgi:hypothetical protein